MNQVKQDTETQKETRGDKTITEISDLKYAAWDLKENFEEYTHKNTYEEGIKKIMSIKNKLIEIDDRGHTYSVVDSWLINAIREELLTYIKMLIESFSTIKNNYKKESINKDSKTITDI